MANLMTKLLQEAQRTKRLIKSAPGQLMDQFSHYNEDWKESSKQTKQHISDAATSGKSGLDEAKVKKAIEEAAGNAIPGGGAAAGIFGGAGRQDLVITRGLSVDSLVRRIFNSAAFDKLGAKQQNYLINRMSTENGNYNGVMRMDALPVRHGQQSKSAPSLISPSLAIHHADEVNPFMSDLALVFNPAKVDPAVTGRAKLYNRDIYSYTSPQTGLNTTSWDGRPAFFEPRLTEGAISGGMFMDHLAQILASGKFKSFAEFEASPTGAKTLDLYQQLGRKRTNLIKDAITSGIASENRTNYDVFTRNKQDLSDGEFVKFFHDYMKGAPAKSMMGRTRDIASKAPSEYAELKYTGELPMTADTLLGAIVTDRSQGLIPTLRQAMPGVPIIHSPQVTIAGSDQEYLLKLLEDRIK